MNQYVYVLQHSYELENGYDETKFLGVFSSYEKAETHESIRGLKHT